MSGEGDSESRVSGEGDSESGEGDSESRVSGEGDSESRVSGEGIKDSKHLRAGGSPGTGAKFKSELLPGVGMEPCGFPHMIFSFFPLITSLPKLPSVA